MLTQLDAVGNTTKAITKGIAIATAVLAATALFGSFTSAISDALTTAGTTAAGVTGITAASLSTDVTSPNVIVGAIIGAAVVFFFSGLLISAVARAAGAVVYEVRRQFREIVGIMEGTALPEYGKVVDIVTRDSLRELATPGLMAVLAPIATGFALGVGALAGYLVGAIAAGALMAVFLANSGGAWDNAKKLVEEGNHGGKGSPAHEATIIGDTVGDPLQGHRRTGHQPAAQGHEPGRFADRAADRALFRGCAPQRAVAHHHRGPGVCDHRPRPWSFPSAAASRSTKARTKPRRPPSRSRGCRGLSAADALRAAKESQAGRRDTPPWGQSWGQWPPPATRSGYRGSGRRYPIDPEPPLNHPVLAPDRRMTNR